MGEIKSATRSVKLIIGLLYSDEEICQTVRQRLELDFGAFDLRSEIIPFTFTDYYREEMGEGLKRQWLSVEPLIRPGQLAKVKVHTNRLERWLAKAEDKGSYCRAVNLDPGYMELSKVVLASTKDFSHRLPIGQGIYGEVTLRWRRKEGFEACGDWTYPDYVSPTANDFFSQVRQIYQEQLKASET